MFRQILATVGILINLLLLTAVLLGIRAPLVGACEAYVPLATRVERTELIVAGYIDSIEPRKYSVQLPEWPEAFRRGAAGVKRTRWLDDATLVVTEILKGTPEFLTTEITADGDTLRSIHILLDGPIQRSDGLSESISTDDHARRDDEGAWFLAKGEIERTYRAPSRAALDDVETIRKSLHAIDTNYAGWTPGIVPDEQTTLVICGSNYYTHAQSVADDDGNVMITGMYRGPFFLGGARQLDSPEWDCFLARLDPKGNVVWCRALGCGQNVSLTLARGLGNTFLLIGDQYAECSLLGSPLPWASTPTRIVMCVSPDAEVLWSQRFVGQVGPANARGARIGVEGLWISPATDHYRIAGSFFGEMSCGKKRIEAKADSDWFVGTLSKNGSVLNLRAICPSGYQHANEALWIDDDRVVMTGACGFTWRDGQPRENQPDVFVSALSAGGGTAWTDTIGGRWSDTYRSAAVGPDGMVVVSMILTSDAITPFVSGAVTDTRLVAGDQSMHLRAWSAKGEPLWDVEGGGDVVVFGNDGKIYCAGSYADRWMGGWAASYLPPSAGDRDIFIECYDAKGVRQWVRRDGGMAGETAAAIHLLPDHRAVLVGNFDGTSYLAGRAVKAQGWSSAFVLNVSLPRERDF